jgi:hypothetical protein
LVSPPISLMFQTFLGNARVHFQNNFELLLHPVTVDDRRDDLFQITETVHRRAGVALEPEPPCADQQAIGVAPLSLFQLEKKTGLANGIYA